MTKFKNAPNIKIPSTNGETFELKKIKNKFLVLYFYPKDDTPGCTIETKDFNSLLSKFKNLDCAVFGVSKDDMKSHDKFKEKYNTYKNIVNCKNEFDKNRFLNNKEKIILVRGLAEKTIKSYLKKNKHTVVSLVYIDFDLYKPALVALKNFIPLMPKGSIIAFDEVNNPDWPGETEAMLKSLKLNKHKLSCFEFEPNISYIELGTVKQ